ncbi:MAG TPA: hemolysin family protein [Armatimonadota bacterium]|jgi:CBS domain containing-hemolysin-like protein
MTTHSILMLLAAAGLVVLNGFFVAAEFALVKVRATRIEELAKGGSPAASLVRYQIRHLDGYLSAAQFGVTLASLALGWIGEPAFGSILEPLVERLRPVLPISTGTLAMVLAFCLITFLHIVFGEQTPKQAAIVRAESTSLLIAYPLHWFYRLCYPPIALLRVSANLVLGTLGLGQGSGHEAAHSEEEIRMLLNASTETGVLEEREVDMMEHVFDFGDTSVHSVMVPRVDIAYLSIDWTMTRVLEVMKERPHTRYLLVEDEDLDRVVGFVHLKDLIHLTRRRSANLEEVRRDLPMVPESQSIDRLLRTFQQNRVQMALVLDEYGGTAGMVTLQDLVEEILGEVPDEFESEAPRIREEDGELRIAGTTSLSEVADRSGLHLSDEEFDTLGGYIMGALGRLPNEGESLDVDGYRLTVEKMAGQRIQEISLCASAPKPVEPPEESGE